MRFKYTIESVKEYIQSKGYKLLSTDYISSQLPLDIECPAGHLIKPVFSEFKRKERCNECSVNKKPTIKEIQDFIAPRGFILLSTEYINNSSGLEVQCSNSHIWSIAWNNLKGGNGCPDCYGNRRIVDKQVPAVQGITHAYTHQEVSDFYQKKNFKLISTFYKNGKQKLDIECDKNHQYTSTFAVSLKGFGCPACSENKKHTIYDIQQHVQKFGYTLVSTFYKNKYTPIELLCPKGHKYSTTFDYFKNGKTRCNSCSHQTSRAEQEVLSFAQTYYPNSRKVRFHQIIENCDKAYRNKELDIYIPEIRVAIEYCGLYWHSDASGVKSSNKHRSKLDWCRANNIRLITIFEDEWISRQAQVKNLLLSVMGVHTTKIGARKTTVQQISKLDAKAFVNTYHIQPLAGSVEVAFGLFHNSTLVGVVTGSKHHRAGNTSFVLQRLCFITNIQIAGGASKLFTALCGWAREAGYDDVVSWSDNRISEGNVYTKLGFALKTEYTPDYSYVLDGFYDRRYSKQSLKKKPAERLLNKTEAALRKDQGYFRIFDCGKKAWIYSLTIV